MLNTADVNLGEADIDTLSLAFVGTHTRMSAWIDVTGDTFAPAGRVSATPPH